MITFEEYWERYVPEFDKNNANIYYKYYVESCNLEMKKDLTISSPKGGGMKAGCFVLDDLMDGEANPVVTEKKKKKENPMYLHNDDEIEAAKINYLMDRLYNTKHLLEAKFRTQFGLEQDTPKTFEDALKRLQTGQFTYSKPKRQYSWNEGLRWTTVPEDYTGFDAALIELDEAKIAAKDVIMSGVYADGLAAIQKFEGFTYTPAPAAAAA